MISARRAGMPFEVKSMNTRIIVDERELKLNRFISDLSGSVIDAIARSLKYTEGRQIEFFLRGDDLTMRVDGNEVPLNLGNASRIVGDLLKGLLKNLYGAENGREIRFICERTS